MPTHEASIDSRELIRPSPPTKSPVNGLSAAPTRGFMDGVPWRKRMVIAFRSGQIRIVSRCPAIDLIEGFEYGKAEKSEGDSDPRYVRRAFA